MVRCIQLVLRCTCTFRTPSAHYLGPPSNTALSPTLLTWSIFSEQPCSFCYPALTAAAMKLTPMLNVRSLVAKLHPPLPATARESAQLLSILQASFRKHLDDAHPPLESTPSTSLAGPGRNTTSSNASAVAASNHLQSILAHPLFARNADERQDDSSAAAKAVAMFDAAMATGIAQWPLMRDCVSMYQSSPPAPSGPKLGPRIRIWFNSSTPSTRENFLVKSDLRHIVPIMYADGEEQAVWEWLRALFAGDFGTSHRTTSFDPKSPTWQAQEANLVYLMVRERIRARNFPAAVQEYAHALRYMIQSGRFPTLVKESDLHVGLNSMLKTSKLLSAFIIACRNKHLAAEDTFNHFLEVDAYWSNIPRYQPLLVQIYHPTAPNADALYASLSRGQFTKLLPSDRSGIKYIITAIQDGAQLYRDQGQPSKAGFISAEIRQIFHNMDLKRIVVNDARTILGFRNKLPSRDPMPRNTSLAIG